MNLIIFSPFTVVFLWLLAAAVDNGNSTGLTALSIQGYYETDSFICTMRSEGGRVLSFLFLCMMIFCLSLPQLGSLFSVWKNWSVQIAKLIPAVPWPGCCCKKEWEGIEGLWDSPFPLDEMQQEWVISGGSREKIRWHSHFTEDNLEFPFAISDYKQDAGNCTHSQLQWLVHKTFFFSQIPSGFYPHFLEGLHLFPV